jgi:hypothetical protein
MERNLNMLIWDRFFGSAVNNFRKMVGSGVEPTALAGG